MKLITITGPSGAGKDTVARMLSDFVGYKVICSYTTRPKREGEIDGVEHHFVEKCDVPRDKMLSLIRNMAAMSIGPLSSRWATRLFTLSTKMG